LKSEEAVATISRQHGVIMRNDKLIVDMNQKNEVCQILIA
jgi:hypothetical protein